MQRAGLIAAACAAACAQLALSGRAQTVEELTAILARAETVDAEAIGYEGERTATYRAYEQWRDRATAAELLACTRHASPTVRAYAVRALVDVEADVDWPRVLDGLLHDTADVTTVTGCCLALRKLGDVCFEAVRPRLTPDQLQDVAEAAIRGRSPLDAREWALRNLTLRDGMLHEVRALAAAGDAAAGIALARYRLPVDVPILMRLLEREEPFDDNAAFLAAQVHPDPRLLPPLLALEPAARERLERDHAGRLRHWLGAIAAQRSAAAGDFLLQLLRARRAVGPVAEREFAAELIEVLAPYADVAAFAAVRAEAAAAAPAAARER
jgi:hypothetical protein